MKSIMLKKKYHIICLVFSISVLLTACGSVGNTSNSSFSDSSSFDSSSSDSSLSDRSSSESSSFDSSFSDRSSSDSSSSDSRFSESISSQGEEIGMREGFSIHEISDDLFDRMKTGNTYKEDCIVPREDLRYLLALHKDKDGNIHQGEMVVHKLIAEEVLDIFEKLYDANYPIERMVLPDNYMAEDETMMRDNNSSCFNFRFISHTTKISKHGLGMAVDINTLYNPYHKIVTNEEGTTEEVIEPATGEPYLDRTREFDYKINKDDLCYQLFIEKGFEWGGDWTDRKDYQHFELPTDITDEYSEMYTK